MKWYNGDIAQAVATSKAKGAIFVVYIEGTDDNSKKITDIIENGPVGQSLEQDHFVAIKLEQGSLSHQQFSEIYKEPSVPSVYFIGKNGVPLDIITGTDNLDNISSRIDNILSKAGIDVVKSTASSSSLTSASETLIQSEASQESENTVVCENGVCHIQTTPSASTSDSSLKESSTSEEKIQKAKELIEIKRKEKEAEEKENERLKELERRKLGQNVQQLKKWQEDQELKEMMEQRDKEKRENQLARQRVLEQIAQDKAERQARMQQSPNSVPPAEPVKSSTTLSAKVNSDNTRLQFKLPDGSTNTQEFANSDTLDTVVTYIKSNLQLSFSNFKLSTTFPRREFTTNDYPQSLMDLELTPNAVILILPLHQGGAISTNPGGTFTALIWSLFAPIFNLFGYIKNYIFGTRNDNNGSVKRPSEESESRSGNVKKRIVRDSTVVRRQGNVHRLTDRNDSDDEGNTWNGNSTQQM